MLEQSGPHDIIKKNVAHIRSNGELPRDLLVGHVNLRDKQYMLELPQSSHTTSKSVFTALKHMLDTCSEERPNGLQVLSQDERIPSGPGERYPWTLITLDNYGPKKTVFPQELSSGGNSTSVPWKDLRWEDILQPIFDDRKEAIPTLTLHDAEKALQRIMLTTPFMQIEFSVTNPPSDVRMKSNLRDTKELEIFVHSLVGEQVDQETVHQFFEKMLEQFPKSPQQ